ncbi:hypothetical protein [Chromobacterium sp. IIBBL 290-4]|uniref:hypothetical protein n=1 Tax=Chromobacterium sp. IIBBL 290-4 TaxID=2953890 RepID=UPI0020B6AA85|nr:hypothetical protein [Chromobacterium sp. IIBBL 290-4]UTH76594.1 hypothetical protein NKT35_11050 [Chromobacterium sp. IIBBL 290-4]
MNSYDEEYYFICYKSAEDRPVLAAQENTATLTDISKIDSNKKISMRFFNGTANETNKSLFKKTPPDILFYGSDIVVKGNTHEEIKALDIPNLVTHPAIYIDQNDAKHGDYWFLNFTKKFDCWDRDRSFYAPDPLTGFGDIRHEVINYHLNSKILEKTKIDDRRLFKMGASTEGWIVAHKSIANLFKISGVELVLIRDFGTSFFP